MKKFGRKTLALVTGLVAALTIAGAAFAAVTFDPETGEGFVGKGDVQLAFGWNNAQLQANAGDVTFTYEETGTFTVVCDGHSNPSQNPRTFSNKVIEVESDIEYESRKNSQGKITGFILEELGDTVSSGEGCPAAWPNEVSRTPNEGAGNVVGLFAHYDGTSAQLTWAPAA